RSSCFASLDVLCARFGDELPYPGGLSEGFAFRGRRIPFLSTQKGIYRAAAQSGPAALAIQTSRQSPYGDAATDAGYLYAYRAGARAHPAHRALAAPRALRLRLAPSAATGPMSSKPVYPCFIVEDDPIAGRVLVSPGKMVGPLDEREPIVVDDPIERRYVFRE